MRHHPGAFNHIAVSQELYQQLELASIKSGFEKEVWEFAAEALDQWTRRHNPDALLMPATRGYQWKSVFLPEGTLLRTVFGGKNHHCMVEADQILYQGAAISPSGFVNAVGGMRRNAWRCIWILFPNTLEWKLAETLRTSSGPRRTHKARGTAPPVAEPPPAQPLPQFMARTERRAKAISPITDVFNQELLSFLHRVCAAAATMPGPKPASKSACPPGNAC
jgi:hypothetical protein